MNLFFVNTAYAADVDTFIRNVNKLILNPLITLLFALAFVYFMYGVFEFIANQDNEEKKTAGKQHMIWGVIGITIMVGVWGILNLVLKTFNITGINPKAGTVNLPNYNGSTGGGGGVIVNPNGTTSSTNSNNTNNSVQ